MEPQNNNGVVVASDGLEHIFDNNNSYFMHSSHFAMLIGRYAVREKDDVHSIILRSWSLVDTLRAFGDFRDWLILMRWTGLELDNIEDNTIVCDMRFKAQKLPDDYREFVRLTALDPPAEIR